MFIKAEDLQVGDHIIVGAGSRLRTLIVLKQPTLRYTNGNDKWYSAVRCSERVIETPHTYNRWDSNLHVGVPYTYMKKDRQKTFDNHNKRVSIDLSYKDIYLVERKTN